MYEAHDPPADEVIRWYENRIFHYCLATFATTSTITVLTLMYIHPKCFMQK
jgi:hypothetical protein